jgi:hypothetical protein
MILMFKLPIVLVSTRILKYAINWLEIGLYMTKMLKLLGNGYSHSFNIQSLI